MADKRKLSNVIRLTNFREFRFDVNIFVVVFVTISGSSALLSRSFSLLLGFKIILKIRFKKVQKDGGAF